MMDPAACDGMPVSLRAGHRCRRPSIDVTDDASIFAAEADAVACDWRRDRHVDDERRFVAGTEDGEVEWGAAAREKCAVGVRRAAPSR